MSATVETEKVRCNASRHKKCTREGTQLYPHIVQGKHASMSSPFLTSEIFVYEHDRMANPNTLTTLGKLDTERRQTNK
jgi:hypothetical protein